jgi:hypothetical protein
LGPAGNQRVVGLAEPTLGRCTLQTNAAKGPHSSHDTVPSLNVVKPALVCASAPSLCWTAARLHRHLLLRRPATSCFVLLSSCWFRCTLGRSPPKRAARCPQIDPDSTPSPATTLFLLSPPAVPGNVVSRPAAASGSLRPRSSSTRRTNCSNSALSPSPFTCVDALLLLPPPLDSRPFLRAP